MDSDVDIVVLIDTTAHAETGLWSHLLAGRLIGGHCEKFGCNGPQASKSRWVSFR
jgi:hypothetical protein